MRQGLWGVGLEHPFVDVKELEVVLGWNEGCYQGWWTFWLPAGGEDPPTARVPRLRGGRTGCCGTRMPGSTCLVNTQWLLFRPTTCLRIRARLSLVLLACLRLALMVPLLVCMMATVDLRHRASFVIIFSNILNVMVFSFYAHSPFFSQIHRCSTPLNVYLIRLLDIAVRM